MTVKYVLKKILQNVYDKTQVLRQVYWLYTVPVQTQPAALASLLCSGLVTADAYLLSA